MSMSFKVIDWVALAPGLTTSEAWQSWSTAPFQSIDRTIPSPKCTQLPMMMARRLNSGSRLAVDCGLTLYRRHNDIDAIIFSSRHGELERNHQILSELATQTSVSPTNFTMSVHNSAVGTLSIITKSTLPTSSLSAGQESFQQGLYEVLSLLEHGYHRVLYVDFDGNIPNTYQNVLPSHMANWPYACAFLLAKGTQWSCTSQSIASDEGVNSALPQSMEFLKGFLSRSAHFSIIGNSTVWHWRYTI